MHQTRLAPEPHRAYTYRVTTAPVNKAVNKTLFILALKIPAAVATADDLLIDQLIAAATAYAEMFTRRDFITRTYLTHRDFFPTASISEGYYPMANFEIRRSRLLTVESIKYFLDTVLTTLDASVYFATDEDDYSEIALNDGQSWPSADHRMQAIQIAFTAGYGPETTDVPVDIQNAIMQLAQAMYFNRGDCSNDACAKAMPVSARTTFLQNRIENL